jgi:hypothetical protein
MGSSDRKAVVRVKRLVGRAVFLASLRGSRDFARYCWIGGPAFIALAPIGALSTSCAPDPCETGETVLDLSVGATDPALSARIQSLAVVLTTANDRGTNTFGSDALRQGGRASIVIIMDTALPPDGGVDVTVHGLDAVQGGGSAIAEDTQHLMISEKACNRAGLDLHAIDMSAGNANTPMGPSNNTGVAANPSSNNTSSNVRHHHD